MSNQGSFITEYMYCNKCFEAVKPILLGNEKYICSRVLPGWDGDDHLLPIIAGKIGGLYHLEELHIFESGTIPEMEKVICHKITIAVIAEGQEPEEPT